MNLKIYNLHPYSAEYILDKIIRLLLLLPIESIKRNKLTEFSRRDAMRLCRRFKTVDSLQPVLTRLCEYGYIAILLKFIV